MTMWQLWRTRTCLLAALLFLAPALAQQQPATTSSNSTTTDNAGSTSTQTTTPTWRPPSELLSDSRLVYLYGQVMVDGVAPPSDSVAIESVCNGIARTEAHTDNKGRFSFRVGEGDTAQDASAAPAGTSHLSPLGTTGLSGGNAGTSPDRRLATNVGRRLEGCELRAKLAGYESETIKLTGRGPDASDIGVILLRRLGSAEPVLVSTTSLAAPKDAQKALRKGREDLAKGKQADARKSLEKAVRIYPKYAVAWLELGRLQLVQREAPAARASFEAAIGADAIFLPPYLALAVIEGAAQEWPRLQETTARAIALDPYGSPRMYFYNALAKYYQQDLEGAEKAAREAERLDKKRDIVGAWELLGSILAARRDFAGAAEQFRTYLALAPQASDATGIRARLDRMDELSASASGQADAK
jgi:tetratricopeptide (TPR) repeat protein